jgi:hypothetical protein
MGDMVIAAYRPKPGCAEALLDLTRDHVPHLRRLGLVTDRPHLILRGQDDTIVEVFEWKDGAIDRAHAMPEIHEVWRQYGEVCDYTMLRDLPESSNLFAQFKPVDV